MARVLGSYPIGRWSESCCRYHFGPLVKRLRHRPFTAESWVQFPYGSPDSNARKHKLSGVFSFCGVRCGEGTRCAVSFFVWERIGQEQNALSGCTKSIVQEQNDSRTVAPKRLLQLSAAGEVFLEGTCPLSRCPQTAKLPAPLLLGARRRWVRKATAFRGRSEQDRSALVCRLLCCDFGNIPVECLQRISLDTNYQTRYNLSLFCVMENRRTRHNLSLQWEKNTSPTALSWISLTDSTIPFLFASPRTFRNLPLFSLAIYAFHIILKANSAFLFVHSYKLLPNLLTN